jgi:tRNA U34 5-methylaminomethyl-2-thiouridine-forming methyltransferase MnmC
MSEMTVHQKHPETLTPTPWGDLVQTRDGSLTIHCKDLGQSYHTHQGAMFEALYLYVKASNIQQALENSTSPEPVSVLDVGLGLGYNAIATLDLWYSIPACRDLHMVSLENNASLVDALVSSKAPWQEGWPNTWTMFTRSLQSQPSASFETYYGTIIHPETDRQCHWTIVVGDGLQTLPAVQKNAKSWDFIWQDPFSFSKAPQLWSSEWFTLLKGHSNPQATLMTYSVARPVRDSLQAAGWNAERIKTSTVAPELNAANIGSAHKRHWLKASPLSTT